MVLLDLSGQIWGGNVLFWDILLLMKKQAPNGVVKFNHFSSGGIYWTRNTGAKEIHGPISDKWASFGWEHDSVYPVTNVEQTPDRIGAYTHFSNGGSIYWSGNTGAREVHGDIRVKWASLGWETGLGYPRSDEIKGPDGGHYNVFGRGDLILSHGNGAFEVHGAIATKYANRIGRTDHLDIQNMMSAKHRTG